MDVMGNFARPEGLLGRMVARGMNVGHASVSRWALSFVDLDRVLRALDVGCGGGGTIRRMLRASPRLQVDGLDYSPDCVSMARRVNRRELGRRCEIRLGSVDAVPYADDTYDLVTAIETIYFWPDVPKALQELSRVLRADGQLLVCCEMGSVELAETYARRIDGMRVYVADEVMRMAREAGFTDVASHEGAGATYCVTATVG